MRDRLRKDWKKNRLFFVYILVITLSIFMTTGLFVLVEGLETQGTFRSRDVNIVGGLILTSSFAFGISAISGFVLFIFRESYTQRTIKLTGRKLTKPLEEYFRHSRAIYLVLLMAVSIVGIGLMLIWWRPVPSWVEMRLAESAMSTYRLSISILTSTITILLSWALIWIFYKPAQFKATREKLSRTLINNRVPVMLVLFALAVLTSAMLLIWKLPAQGMEGIFNDQLNLTIAVIGAFSLAIVAIFNLNANNRRANTAEKQQAHELLVSSIQNLGNVDSATIRIGAVYGLERLTKDSPEVWKDKVAKILCAHIRDTTRDPNYQKENRDEPSVEILTIMEALSTQDSPFVSVELDLKGAYLAGLNIINANLANSKLDRANLRGAVLNDANLAWANLRGANISHATLIDTDLTSANLSMANLKGADLVRAVLSETMLRCARLTGANLIGASLHGAELEGSFSSQITDELITEELSPKEIFKLREYQKADLTGCLFVIGTPTDLTDIYCGALTRNLYSPGLQAMMGQFDDYRHKPTQADKEQLVGKNNVDKCIWGDIITLEERN